MRKSLFFMLSFFLVIFLPCCLNNSDNGEEIVPYNINIGQLEKKLLPENFITATRYLKLETNNNCLIRRIDKLRFKNELIYILDRLSKSIFVFNMQGKYIKKYYHYGKGPGEYINLGDFDLSKDGNFIYLLDYTQYKLCKYSLDNELIEEVKLEFGTTSFSCLEDDVLVFYQKNRMNPHKKSLNNNILYFDFQKNRAIRGCFPIKDKKKVIGNYALYPSDSNLYYCPYVTDKVYKINQEGIEPYVNILGVNKIEDEIWNINNSSKFLQTIINAEYQIDFHDFYVLDSIITFSYMQDRSMYYIYYSMKSKKMIYGNGFARSDPNHFPGNFNTQGTYDDYFVSSFSPTFMLKKSYQIFPIYAENPEKHLELIELSKQTAITDNPIIVFFKINF